MSKQHLIIFIVLIGMGSYFFMNMKGESSQDALKLTATQKIHQKILDKAGSLKNKKVLDYGCGCGGMVELLLQQTTAPQVILAVDSDENAIEDIESLYAPSILKGMLKAQRIDNPRELDDQKFDVIVCHNVLEYMENPERFVQELYDLLAPNGVLIVAHQDFDSEIFNSSYRDLTRELVHFFADRGEEGQAKPDGQIARKMPGTFKRAGIENVQFETWRLVETTFTSNDYGFVLTDMLLKTAQQKFDKQVLADWFKDLEAKAQANDFYFAIDVVIARVQK